MAVLAFGLIISAPLMAAEEKGRPDILNILTARLATAANAEEAEEIAEAMEEVYSESQSPSAEELVSQSRLVILDGDERVALYKLDRALILDQNLVAAYVLRGEVHLSAGRTNAAFADAMEAVERAPDYYAGLALLARTFELRGHSASALATSQQALTYYPLSEELQEQLARHQTQAAGAGL